MIWLMINPKLVWAIALLLENVYVMTKSGKWMLQNVPNNQDAVEFHEKINRSLQTNG